MMQPGYNFNKKKVEKGILFLEHWTYEETDDSAQYQGSDGVHLP